MSCPSGGVCDLQCPDATQPAGQCYRDGPFCDDGTTPCDDNTDCANIGTGVCNAALLHGAGSAYTPAERAKLLPK